MSLLVSEDVLRVRSHIAINELEPLLRGLRTELSPVVGRDLYLPHEKALLSREGGRCSRDGATLEFDPFSPRRHRCPVCGEVYTGIYHDRFWVFWYQLWLAERAVHGALLARLRGDESAGMLSRQILERYSDEYLLYANRDNVLGPTRLFFSTYLESIWLLNICIALDLLESGEGKTDAIGDAVRERIIEPSAALIASYDEGASNRQVWNDAALVAANLVLGLPARAEQAVFGRSGIVYHLENGLLPDGTWYEGENYHLFAHRGLWYGVTMAESAGMTLPRALADRFQEGFATPFLTALPDMTLPSRRDSQYKISLRQSRFAELAELGLAREQGDGDRRLRAALYHLYRDEWPRGDTGRARTTADVERNLPGTALTRADLGWRSLLFARAELPELSPELLGTVLLEAQGLAVFRRQRDRIYVALDYGTSGGGHGHPDRLNILLSDGATRWLDDMGTGSYVDPSLHWYRSTLAHNAPLFNGYEQQRVDGELLAFDEHAEAGWICARAFDLYPGVRAKRSVIVRHDYMFDELVWDAKRSTVMDLPIHVVPHKIGIQRFEPDAHLELYALNSQLEDTLGALTGASGRWLGGRSIARIVARNEERVLYGFLVSSHSGMLYRVTGPGAPGQAPRAFILLRVPSAGETAWVRTIWDWAGSVEAVRVDDSGVVTKVLRRDASYDRLRHISRGFRVAYVTRSESRRIELGGLVPFRRRTKPPVDTDQREPLAILVVGEAVVFELGERQYRRSEESWEEAGRPTARIGVLVLPNELVIDVGVTKRGALTFASEGAVNPYDNEAPDINGDGVQLYVVDDAPSAWVLVPARTSESNVRARTIDGWDSPRSLRGIWQQTADGYVMRIRLGMALVNGGREFALGVVVNEKPFGRERRRGQLVLGGSPGEFVYLRGDREDRQRLPWLRVVP